MEVVAPRGPTLREALELDWVDITKIFSSRGSMKEVPKFLIGFLGQTLKFVLERKQQEFLIESPSTKRESGSCCGSSLAHCCTSLAVEGGFQRKVLKSLSNSRG